MENRLRYFLDRTFRNMQDEIATLFRKLRKKEKEGLLF